MVVIMLAAGLIGYARLGSWLLSRRRGRIGLAVVWLASAGICGVGLHDVIGRLSHVRAVFDRSEARDLVLGSPGRSRRRGDGRLRRLGPALESTLAL